MTIKSCIQVTISFIPELIENGCSKSIKNKKGLTALDILNDGYDRKKSQVVKEVIDEIFECFAD